MDSGHVQSWQRAVYFAPLHDFLVQYVQFVFAYLTEPYDHSSLI